MDRADGSFVIPLTRGLVTIVDREDFERYGHLKWFACREGYAARSVNRADGGVDTILLHRLIAGAEPWEDAHHRNENKLDNRRNNLKLLSHGDHSMHHNRIAG